MAGRGLGSGIYTVEVCKTHGGGGTMHDEHAHAQAPRSDKRFWRTSSGSDRGQGARLPQRLCGLAGGTDSGKRNDGKPITEKRKREIKYATTGEGWSTEGKE